MPGFSGHGAKFWVQRGNGSFYRVGAIMDVSGPSLSTADVDITTNDSPAHTKEFIASLIGGGEVTFPTLIDVARFNTLRSYQVAQATLSMALLLPSVPQVLVTCDGYVKGLDNSVAMEEAITSEMTLMVTNVVRILSQPVGPLALTPGTGVNNLPAPGDNQTAQVGWRSAADSGSGNAQIGDLELAEGGRELGATLANVAHLYHNNGSVTLANRGLHLKIDSYTPDLSDNEFYLRIGDDVLYRVGQDGGVADTTTPANFDYTWGGAIGASSPFTDGTEITVQVFAE